MGDELQREFDARLEGAVEAYLGDLSRPPSLRNFGAFLMGFSYTEKRCAATYSAADCVLPAGHKATLHEASSGMHWIALRKR